MFKKTHQKKQASQSTKKPKEYRPVWTSDNNETHLIEEEWAGLKIHAKKMPPTSEKNVNFRYTEQGKSKG